MHATGFHSRCWNQVIKQLPGSHVGVQPHDLPVSRRKNQWRDADEMFQRFKDRPPFNSWQLEVLRDYCDYALSPAEDDVLNLLACDPINEASIYLNQKKSGDIHNELGSINTPTTLLRAPPRQDGILDLSSSPTWPALARALPNCKDIYLPQCSHFIPMQEPALVAQHIRVERL